jgi:hypothetical protein
MAVGLQNLLPGGQEGQELRVGCRMRPHVQGCFSSMDTGADLLDQCVQARQSHAWFSSSLNRSTIRGKVCLHWEQVMFIGVMCQGMDQAKTRKILWSSQ